MDSYEIPKEVTDRFSLRGRVFHKIREDILSGRYREHEELKEATLGEELGVSRTPVREALRQLELEGLVTIVPNKGAYVTGITPKDIRDIYTIRSYLEGLCARWATEHITEKQLDELEEIVYLAEYNARKEKHEQLFEQDGRFHRILYEASGSKILIHVLSDFHNYVQQIRKTAYTSGDRSIRSVEEHKQILNAIRDKDADRAEQLANAHMCKVIENMQKNGIDNMIADLRE